jgi:HlyD family secretion protein
LAHSTEEGWTQEHPGTKDLAGTKDPSSTRSRLRRRLVFAVVGILVAATVAWTLVRQRSDVLVLTGIVTTQDVIVSPQVAGQLDRLLVAEGDVVKKGQLLAVIAPEELRADRAYYASSAEGFTAQVREGEAALRFQEQQTRDQIRQAEATLAATRAQRAEAEAALESARLSLERTEGLYRGGISAVQDYDQARTSFEAAKAHVEALGREVDAEAAAVALARANADQVAVKRSQLQADEHQRAAADAQRDKADVRLGYAELRAPIDGFVDVRAARAGEVLSAGQPVLTLVDPDDLWIRADVEETYIDRVRLGDTMTVRLPSGEERTGTVFYRGADAGFATQRDVSRTKRDIRTFEIRLRVDNRDRRLAVGMTAYVLFPISGNPGGR